MKFIIMDLRQKKNNRQIIHVDGYSLLLLLQLIFLVPYSTAQSDRVPPPPPLDQQNFRPSMLVVILVLITAFFFMGFFSIYIRQCVGRGGADTIRPVNGGVGGGVGRSRRTKKGLDPSVIETFPTFLYSAVKALKLGKGTLECAVCLNEFEDDETLRLLPKCDHVFHPECIDAWLVSHTTCPVCRCNLNEITSPPNQEQDQNTLNQDQIQSEDSSDSDSDLNQTRLNQINNNNNESQEQVLIRITDDQIRDSSLSSSSTMKPEVINPSQIQNQNRRPVRSRSSIIPKIAGKFPRSHSTGHSLIQPGENVDRFTLRLPEDVRKQIIIENEKLNRTMRQSSISGGGGGDSNRPGFRSGSVGRFYQFGRLSKSDHWGFKLSMPFFTRSTSSRAPITTTDGSVKLPFDRLGSKADRARGEADQSSSSSSARPPV